MKKSVRKNTEKFRKKELKKELKKYCCHLIPKTSFQNKEKIIKMEQRPVLHFQFQQSQEEIIRIREIIRKRQQHMNKLLQEHEETIYNQNLQHQIEKNEKVIFKQLKTIRELREELEKYGDPVAVPVPTD